MGIWKSLRNLTGVVSRKERPQGGEFDGREGTRDLPLDGARSCHFEVMEPRRVLDADPVLVGAVYIEDDSGTDSAGDTFYVAFQGGSSTTTLSRVVIDGNQDGNPNALSEPDVYFDTIASNQNGQGNGSGGASPFTLSNKSIGVTADQVRVSVVDGGTRIVLDIEDFRAGDVLVFTIDVDQFFSNKPDDQVTSGIEFAGSSVTAVFQDPHYDFAPRQGSTDGVFQYQFGFGSDDVQDTGVLSMLPSKQNRETGNGLATIENRTAGALDQFSLTPKPVTIAGNVWHDRDLDLIRDSGEEAISGVTLRLQMKDANGNYVDVVRNGSSVTTLTDGSGHYEFGSSLGLMPGTYRVVQQQPTGYDFSVGEVPGTVAGSAVGTSPGENVLSEITIPLGDQHAINYDFAEARGASLSGHVYHDRNDNGIRESGEEGIGGVQLLITPVSTIGVQLSITTTTDANGFYSVTGLAPGEYTVTEVVQPAGYVDGKDTPGTVDGIKVGSVVNPGDHLSKIVLNSGSQGINYDFGELRYGSISGHVKIKTPEGDCVSFGDPRYRPIPGVVIELHDASGNVIRSTVTDAQGKYRFDDLPAGVYSVVEIMPANFPYLQGTAGVGTIDGISVGSNATVDQLTQIALGPGQNGINYDFCEVEPAQISGHVYHDLDDDGLRESGEPPIAGATISLFDADGNKVAETKSDGTGYYVFSNLYRGTYRIVETQPSGWIDGKESLGSVNGVATGTVGADRFDNIVILGGQTGANYDFGEIKLGSIGGRVKTDLDGDCVYEPGIGERPISGVTVELRDATGKVIATRVTGADGLYLFDNLRPGEYSVFEHQPTGLFHQGQQVGYVDGTSTVGPGVVAGQDLVSSITITSGLQLRGYDFCEVPGASISGFVYQDGATINALFGQTYSAAELAAMRDGQLSGDDTRLAGVVLELRNGITGEPIMASAAAPGVYASGPIRTTTDANGFYIFTGLPAGNYAVFQIQPDGYTDHLDTAGTTSGVAVNPALGIDTSVLSTLSAGVNTNNDAILRIALGVGQQSQLNNFSEVRVQSTPYFPPPETPQLPPINLVQNRLDPTIPLGLFGQQTVGPNLQVRFRHWDPTADYSWHLSVINNGTPRGNADPTVGPGPGWESASFLSREKWLSIDMTRGNWTQGKFDETTGEASEVRRVEFGAPDGIPVVGDFNGDGTDEVAIYNEGDWFVDINGNGRWDQDDLYAQLGTSQDRPVTGDWDGDGKDDIGIYGPMWPRDPVAIETDPGLPDPDNRRMRDPKNVPPGMAEATDGARTLKLTADGLERQDLIDHVFAYGDPVDVPIAGDWNGDGIRTIGVFHSGTWRLDLDGDGRWTRADGEFEFGDKGDVPVIGDWNGDGIEEIGVFRAGTWILDTNGNREIDATDRVFEMGETGDRPITGDWDGDGIDDPGLYRASPPAAWRQAG